MATKQTGVTLKVSAVNAAGRVFKNIASSAVGVTKSIAKWGSVAAAAAIGGFAAVANKLGSLSDVAQAAGATTDEITKLSTALNVLGVKGSKPEELAAAFQRMTKATGLVGVEGFHKIVEEISKLPTLQDRATAAMKIFGKTGMQFMPVIEGAAKNGIGALKDLEAGMPGISQAAADAADSAADAMSVLWSGLKSAVADGVGEIAKMIDSNFTGGVREAAMVGAAQMKYFALAGFRYVSAFVVNFRQVFGETFDWFLKVMNNVATAIGGILVTAFEDAKSRVTGVLDDIAAGAAALIARLQGDKDREMEILRTRWREQKVETADRKKNWNETFKLLEGLDWKYEGIMANIDTGDLAAQRDAAIETARKAGEAYGKAAVKVGSADLARIGVQGGGAKRADTTNPEAIMGGSYKALTYALRQGYATGIQEVKNLLKKTVDGLKGVKDAVKENHLDLAEG